MWSPTPGVGDIITYPVTLRFNLLTTILYFSCRTPVSDVFRGELRSDLFQEGLKATATLEPFFTLPLDINDQKPRWSVNEALEHLTRMETVQDFTNAKTKVKVGDNVYYCVG